MKFFQIFAVLTALISLSVAQIEDTEGPENPTSQGPTSTRDYLTCDDGDDQMDPPDCPQEDPEGHPSYFPYPYDCRKYFECTNGVAKCIKCAPGTVWDQNLLTCNHELVVPCVIVTTTTPLPTTPTTTTPTTTPTTTTPTTTTPTTTTPTTTTPTTTTPTTTTPTTTTPTTTTTEEPTTTDDPATWICPEGYIGRMGHPYNCRQFYICDPGRRPCLYDCPGDLYYNPVTQDCDWQENVPSCQGGSPPPPTSTTPRVNYRNIRRFRTQEKSWFSIFSFFRQEETTPSSSGPCDEPTAKYEYY